MKNTIMNSMSGSVVFTDGLGFPDPESRARDLYFNMLPERHFDGWCNGSRVIFSIERNKKAVTRWAKKLNELKKAEVKFDTFQVD